MHLLWAPQSLACAYDRFAFKTLIRVDADATAVQDDVARSLDSVLGITETQKNSINLEVSEALNKTAHVFPDDDEIRAAYTPRMRILVENKYSIDFQIMGYRFPT